MYGAVHILFAKQCGRRLLRNLRELVFWLLEDEEDDVSLYILYLTAQLLLGACNSS